MSKCIEYCFFAISRHTEIIPNDYRFCSKLAIFQRILRLGSFQGFGGDRHSCESETQGPRSCPAKVGAILAVAPFILVRDRADRAEASVTPAAVEVLEPARIHEALIFEGAKANRRELASCPNAASPDSFPKTTFQWHHRHMKWRASPGNSSAATVRPSRSKMQREGAAERSTPAAFSPLARWGRLLLAALFLTPVVVIIVNVLAQLSSLEALLLGTYVPVKIDFPELLTVLGIVAVFTVALTSPGKTDALAPDEAIEAIRSKRIRLSAASGIGLSAVVLTFAYAWSEIARSWSSDSSPAAIWSVLIVLVAGQTFAVWTVFIQLTRTEKALLAHADLPGLERQHDEIAKLWVQRWKTPVSQRVDATHKIMAIVFSIGLILGAFRVGSLILDHTYSGLELHAAKGAFVSTLYTSLVFAFIMSRVLTLHAASSKVVVRVGLGSILVVSVVGLPTTMMAFAGIVPGLAPFAWTVSSFHLVFTVQFAVWGYPQRTWVRRFLVAICLPAHVIRQQDQLKKYRIRERTIEEKKRQVKRDLPSERRPGVANFFGLFARR